MKNNQSNKFTFSDYMKYGLSSNVKFKQALLLFIPPTLLGLIIILAPLVFLLCINWHLLIKVVIAVYTLLLVAIVPIVLYLHYKLIKIFDNINTNNASNTKHNHY